MGRFGLSAKLGTRDFSRMSCKHRRHNVAQLSAGTAPADLTVTGLAKALPYSWAEQESSIGFPAIRVFRARGLHAASGLIALRLRIIR